MQTTAAVLDYEHVPASCDILINNAGIQHVAPIDEFPTAKWDAIIAINMSSAFSTPQPPRFPRCAQQAGAGSSISHRRMV